MSLNLFDDSDEGFPESRGSWEPRSYYFFRRLFRISLGAFLLFLCAFAFGPRHPYHRPQTYYLVAAIALGAALAGAVIGGVGLFFSVPVDKKRRRKEEPHDDWSSKTRKGL